MSKEVTIDGVTLTLDDNEEIESLKEFEGAFKKDKKENDEED